MKKNILFFILVTTIYSCTEHTKTTTIKFTDKSIKDSIIPLTNADTLKKDTVVVTKVVNDSIIPGKSIGNVFIDESSEEVIAKLGKPDSSDAGMGKIIMTWYAQPTMKNEDTVTKKLVVFATIKTGQTDGKYRVKKIHINSPIFKTIEQVGCGSTLAFIKLQYPTLKKPVSNFTDEFGNMIDVYDEKEKGIAFEICNNKCKGVVVHIAGQKIT